MHWHALGGMKPPLSCVLSGPTMRPQSYATCRSINSRRSFATAGKDKAQESDIETSGDMLEVGDFRIDTRRHRATLLGEPLELTSEELDVLVFLTTNPQRVVTPQTTLATHWTGARTHQTQFLRVLLSLQKKLETAATGKQYLRTEPWVIYRFDPASSAK